MDSMKSKSKFKIKVISSLLNEALSEFSERGGNLPSKGNTQNKMEKFKHITGISCVPQSSNLPAGYYLCWHLAHLVRNQEKLRSAEDLPKICLEIERSQFDSIKESARIQTFLARVIN